MDFPKNLPENLPWRLPEDSPVKVPTTVSAGLLMKSAVDLSNKLELFAKSLEHENREMVLLDIQFKAAVAEIYPIPGTRDLSAYLRNERGWIARRARGKYYFRPPGAPTRGSAVDGVLSRVSSTCPDIARAMRNESGRVWLGDLQDAYEEVAKRGGDDAAMVWRWLQAWAANNGGVQITDRSRGVVAGRPTPDRRYQNGYLFRAFLPDEPEVKSKPVDVLYVPVGEPNVTPSADIKCRS